MNQFFLKHDTAVRNRQFAERIATSFEIGNPQSDIVAGVIGSLHLFRVSDIGSLQDELAKHGVSSVSVFANRKVLPE